MGIRHLPAAERPRERCWRLGVQSLSAQELLALVVGGGGQHGGAMELARRLLEQFPSLGALSEATVDQLSSRPGLALARSSALAAAFELGRRAHWASLQAFEVVEGPERVAEILGPFFAGLHQEAVVVAHLGSRHQVLRIQLVALGTLNAASIEPREVFRGAIAAGAAAIVLADNHPSGSADPSEDDVRLTRRLARCGGTLGIDVLDHIVIGRGTYTSLRERGDF